MMALDVEQLVVRRSVTVEAPQERCFEVFTARFDSWWPLATHHIAAVEASGAVIEPFAGGRWFERAPDGSECDWGRVLDWEPPARIRLAWMLDAQFAYDPDESHATEVEVAFVPEGAGRTRVELVHSGFERVLDGAKMQQGVGGDGGWDSLLQLFAEAASRA
jgi:uncharacterized protein YndB with AHSA1/START domain